MALQVVITAPPQLVGEYDLEFEFTHGELDLIERVSGKAGLELDDAMERGNTTVILCLGVIGALRAGRLRDADKMAAVAELMKTKVGSVSLRDDEPAEEPTPEASTGTDEPGESQNSSYETTQQPSGDPPEQTLEATGVPI